MEGHELLEGVLNLLHLDRLGEDDEAVVGGKLLSEGLLLGAEQDQRDELMAFLVGLLVHVEKRSIDSSSWPSVSKMTASTGDFAIALGGDLGVGDQQHLVAHGREGLAEGVLDLGLGFDAQDALGGTGLGAGGAGRGRPRAASRARAAGRSIDELVVLFGLGLWPARRPWRPRMSAWYRSRSVTTSSIVWYLAFRSIFIIFSMIRRALRRGRSGAR